MREFKSVIECLDHYLGALLVASELEEIEKFCGASKKDIVMWRLCLPVGMVRVRLIAFLLGKNEYQILGFDKSSLRYKIIFLLGYNLIDFQDLLNEINFHHSTDLFFFLFNEKDISEENRLKLDQFVQRIEFDKLQKDVEEKELKIEKVNAFLKDFEALTSILKKMELQLQEMTYDPVFKERVIKVMEERKKQKTINSFGFFEISDSLHVLLELIDTPVLNPV